MTLELVLPVLSPDEARALTDKVRAQGLELREDLLRLYEGGAHIALGHTSWKAYWDAEFDTDWSIGYKTIRSERVRRAIGSAANEPLLDYQAAAFAPLLNVEEKGTVEAGTIIDAYTEAAAKAEQRGSPVTAAIIKEVVAEKLPAKLKRPKKNPAKMGTNKQLQEVIDDSRLLVKHIKHLDPDCWESTGGNFRKQVYVSMKAARVQLEALIAEAEQHLGTLDKPLHP